MDLDDEEVTCVDDGTHTRLEWWMMDLDGICMGGGTHNGLERWMTDPVHGDETCMDGGKSTGWKPVDGRRPDVYRITDDGKNIAWKSFKRQAKGEVFF